MRPVITSHRNFQQSSHILVRRPVEATSKEASENDGPEGEEDLPEEFLQTSNVRIDDGGSNLTDRFKYKVSVHFS